MFDAADLIALPGLVPGAGDGGPTIDVARDRVAGVETASAAAGGVLNRNLSHVIEACAMRGHDVALAMSNGELCHANISKRGSAAEELVPTEDTRWPKWTSWPTRHGKILSLQYDPAHDALVTIEQATTAAGDQAFLGRYHRQAGLVAAGKERERGARDGRGGETSEATATTPPPPWVGSSVPLATNRAVVAVCASRGWVAICTRRSVVNLWAVARQSLEAPNPRRVAPRLRQARAPVGFEHALSVDLAELVGARDGMGEGGGAKHIALHGNLLAVATDHAVFLVHLTFDVKGEISARSGSAAAADSTAPPTPISRGDAESPRAASPQSQPPRASPRAKPTAAGWRGPSAALKPDYSKDFPPKSASRGGASSSSRGKQGSASVDEGSAGRSSASPGVRKDGGKARPERRDGVVERAVSEADDLVVCVLDPGGEEDGGREADGSTQPPPLLRGFDDDWEAFRARGDYSAEQPEAEAAPLATELTSSVSLPVSGNSTVLDRVGGCDVVLARRVGPAEVVKQLHLLPASQRDEDETPCSNGQQGTASPEESRRSPARPCRFVLLTSKGATICLVRARPACSAAPVALSPYFPPSGRPPSPAYSERRSPTQPSSSAPFTSSAGHRTSHLGGRSRPSGGRLSADLGAGAGAGDMDSAGADNVAGDREHLDVFLRRACRFNHDLVLASITRTYLFVLTVEGVEVWTFPSDELLPDKPPPEAGARRAGRWEWSEESGLGGVGTPLFLSRLSPRSSPRPCLLHVQQLEINGVVPRSPPSCMVPLGGAAPGLLLFPSPPANQHASLAFLAQQCQRRLRSHVAADDPGEGSENIPAFRKPSSPENPFEFGGSNPDAELEQGRWQRKLAAWREGFCGVGRDGAAATAPASPLALFLRLRTPTEAFRLLSAAAGRSPRPLSARMSSVFVSAAEGLHGALTAEAADAWRAAVCPQDHGDGDGDDGVGLAERIHALSGTAAARGDGGGDGGGATAEKPAEIERVLAGVANCWRLQRAAARCASLLGRLLLEAAVSVGEQWSAEHDAAAAVAYARACSWMLASGEPVVRSLALLRDAAARVLAAGGEMERTLSGAPSFVMVDDEEEEGEEEDDHDREGPSYLTTAEASPPNLEKLLPQAMYESYLLPALGVGDTPEAHSRGPQVSVRDQEPPALSLGDALSGLVGYLHRQDMRRVSQRPSLQGLGDGTTRRSSTLPLATAVVYADRAPWAACPAALSEALAALDQQDKALADSTSGNTSSSSCSSGTSLSGRKSPPGVPGVAKRSKPASKARRGSSSEHRRGSSSSGPSLDSNQGPAAEGSGLLLPAQEWIAVARAVLLGYSEQAEKSGATSAVSPGPSVPAADARILQLACERHPSLVAPAMAHVAPARLGAGPLARDLLAGGRAQPVVAALVNLTFHGGCDGLSGSGNVSFGPHKALGLLQLKEDCFSPPVDPLTALHVFGVAGRQIAARLDSLRRASLDLPGAFGFPTEARHFDGNPHEQSKAAVGSRQQERGDAKVLSAAARDFLSWRCSASLARAGPSARHPERLSQALGAPEGWQASFARNRALDRAILRFLIGAHLDDLRALENSPAAGNPKAASGTPGGWGGGLARAASSGAGHRRGSEGSSWADAIVPLLSGRVSTSRARVEAAEQHVEAILCIIREISWRAGRADGSSGRGGGGGGCDMSHEEAEEVVTEAKRRLPVSDVAPAPPASASGGTLTDDDEAGQMDDETHPWGSGGDGMGARRALWPWGPRAVPASAVGAVLALAAALPPAGKLLAGLDVMLQVGAEVVAAAKSEAAVSAGAVAAASGSAGKGGGGVRGHAAPKSGSRAAADAAAGEAHAHADVEEVCRAAERALLLYTSEYCGKDPEKWASVTEHVRNTADEQRGKGGAAAASAASDGSGSVGVAGHRLVRALLRRCGEELGGKALVRALPESLTLVECLDEVERSLLSD